MNIQLIRNATLRIKYAGKTILLDPFFAPKGSLPAFAGIAPNPTVDLPHPVADIIDSVDLVLITHLHPDHFDESAQEALPKHIPIICHAVDRPNIEDKGFHNIDTIGSGITWEGIDISPTPAQHGSGEWLARMGHVTGYFLKKANSPSLYLASDTILTDDVLGVLSSKHPDVIVTNSGGAHFPDAPPIIMDAEETITLCKAAPEAKVVATHLESLDHCPVTREALREAAAAAAISDKHLYIPSDGETLTF
ncbi:MBL fold metallo-hydrolase [Rubritalea tangerina]|uniref:MBL fold metallo-hydrolase n=1 Tax=Rubritalea tangerina TaxID=430798 RepID=A0ABW4ZE18_9BACT